MLQPLLESIIFEKASFKDANNVAPLYIKVFEGHPWYEKLTCNTKFEGCGVTYVEEKDGPDMNVVNGRSNLFILDGSYDNCKNCDSPLDKTLTNFWEKDNVVSDYSKATSDNSFIGLLGSKVSKKFFMKKLELVGFVWGFGVESNTMHNKDEIANLLVDLSIDPSSTFYHSEIGIDPEFQMKGIGTKFMSAFTDEVRNNGFSNLIYRTTNTAMIKVYEKLFKNHKELFNDPNPSKDQIWYGVKL
ncbi:MAG: GNAT family N-acetyltransferase [Nanoarchaeota archaeon]|nr:GNAT family N-acetyltransferase [Nanoarchaeota archaeon]